MHNRLPRYANKRLVHASWEHRLHRGRQQFKCNSGRTEDGSCGSSSQGTAHLPLQGRAELGSVLLIHLSSQFASSSRVGKPTASMLPASTQVSRCRRALETVEFVPSSPDILFLLCFAWNIIRHADEHVSPPAPRASDVHMQASQLSDTAGLALAWTQQAGICPPLPDTNASAARRQRR